MNDKDENVHNVKKTRWVDIKIKIKIINEAQTFGDRYLFLTYNSIKKAGMEMTTTKIMMHDFQKLIQ